MLFFFQLLRRFIRLPPPVLCDLVPDLGVDPQGSGQGQVGMGAGNPAAQGAGDGADDAVNPGHRLQAWGAECVVAVKDPGDAVAAGELVAADDALEVFT